MASMMKLQLLARSSSRLVYPSLARLYSSDEGAIRDAGGAFSKREKAQEDQYFRRLQEEQMKKLKEHASEHHEEEIQHHNEAIDELKEQIRRHEDKIKRHKKKMEEDH